RLVIVTFEVRAESINKKQHLKQKSEARERSITHPSSRAAQPIQLDTSGPHNFSASKKYHDRRSPGARSLCRWKTEQTGFVKMAGTFCVRSYPFLTAFLLQVAPPF